MNGRQVRVLIVTEGARNPFLEAWLSCIRSSGAATTILLDTGKFGDDFVPDILRDDVAVVRAGDDRSWVETVRGRLGGDPDVLYDYWSMGSLLNTVAASVWPKAGRVVSVDTFPNASRRRAEARDVAVSNLFLGRAAGLSVASETMARAVRRATLGRSARLPTSVVYSPFPLAAHADAGAPRSFADRVLTLCFTGRSDYLFSADPRMAKDAVGPYLERFLAAGAEVHIMRPDDTAAADALAGRGFRFYPPTERAGMTDGTFARMLSRFHGHLVTYAPAGPVVRRRVESSLSTRFATAVCAPTPIVAPREAVFTREFFGPNPVGFQADEPQEVLDRLRADGDGMVAAWRAGHERWAGESNAGALARQWEQVMDRGR